MNPTNGDGRAFWQQRSFKDERDIILASGPVAVVTRLQNTFRDAMLLRLKRLLGDRLPARKLVDIGCAIGDWTLAYAHNGFASEVVGVEFNQGFVARARESAARFGGAAGQLRFVEGDANTTDEIAGADLVCMGGFLQSLTEAEATALLERVAQAQRGGGAMYIRTSCPPRGGARPPNDYHRSHDWYQALFARLGYRILDAEVSAAIAVQTHAALLGRSARALGRLVAWFHTRVIKRNRLEYVNWVLVKDEASLDARPSAARDQSFGQR